MKTIEDEIKQKKFQNIYIKTDVNFLFTSGWLENIKSRFFKQFDLSLQQYNVLRILRGQYPDEVMLTQITERMIDKMSNATRLVEKLRMKQLVTRELNEHNRRQVDIRITEKGLELLSKIDIALEKDMPPAYYSNVTEEELKQFNHILDKIRSGIE